MTSQDDLFAEQREDRRFTAAPLAARMRPRSLDEVAGQQHLVGPGTAFRALLDSGKPTSLILWGPAGTGKTTLARLTAKAVEARFAELSATSAGVKDVRAILASARQRLEDDLGRTVLFLDEIHRFSKSQQDALLPGVEDGTIVLVGATTENPFFEVNSPLISRCTVFRTEALEPEDIVGVIDAARTDAMRGLGGEIEVADGVADVIAERVGGDARLALNTLDVAAAIVRGSGRNIVEVDDVTEALQRRVIRYDKGGDRHYDVISAFIKSVRGSDPDAAMYWLHTMIEAGEDPKFIARRLVILASEDIGLADSNGLRVATDAFRAIELIGLPEGAYALSHATIYLAVAPKSNSITKAIGNVRDLLEQTPGATVPPHLRSAAAEGQKAFGDGVGYLYPHDDPTGVLEQQYLPDEAITAIVYQPGSHGHEARFKERLAEIDARLGKRARR
ncbi:MAG: replication-associated recombination protein A [bacterium]|nr:replication-associated recombination protein A [bacterium]MCP4967895.1 replication-associated recombination protein A [bacterium]